MKKKLPVDLKYLFSEPTFMWQKYHDKTKWRKFGKFLDPKDWPQTWKTIYYKDYPRLDKIILPPAGKFTYSSFEDILMWRHSSRFFGKTQFSLKQLSTLLWYSAAERTTKPNPTSQRTYPSPGGRYTLEIYIVSLNSELPVGIYHYNVRQHSLEILEQMEHIDTLLFVNQDWIQTTGCIIFFTGVFARNTIKYGERGYRHVLQEAGHLGQNFYLIANALDINICAVGGYSEPKIDQLLDVDGLNESTIYVLTIGNKS